MPTSTSTSTELPITMPPRLEQEATAAERKKPRVPWYRQPYKTAYLTFQFGLLFFFIVPYLCFRYIIPSQRPNPSWTWLQSVILIVIRDVVRIGTNSGLLQAKKDVTKANMPSDRAVRRSCGSACQAVFLEPMSENDVVGEIKELMIKNDVHPAGVPVYWYGENIAEEPIQRAAVDEKLVVHFHGGGYVVRIISFTSLFQSAHLYAIAYFPLDYY